jgi:hypothetical protein
MRQQAEEEEEELNQLKIAFEEAQKGNTKLEQHVVELKLIAKK